jgi:hypothetical protein
MQLKGCALHSAPMQVQYKIVDEVIGDARKTEAKATPRPVKLTLVSATLTAREIISEKARSHFHAAVKDSDIKATSRMDVVARLKKQVNQLSTEEATVKAALTGFLNNRYFLFWNDEQVTSLDQKLQVMGDNHARFIQLIPLKGG